MNLDFKGRRGRRWERTHPATRRRGDIVTASLCTSQRSRRYVSNETPKTSQWSVVKTCQWYVFTTSYWYVVTTSQGDVMTTSHQYVSTASQISLKWNTQRHSVVRHQDVSVVRIHDVPLVRLYDVSCNSQMKHPITSLWYVSTTSQSYVAATPCLYYGLYYVFKLLCHGLQLVGFHVSFKHQIKHHVFLVPARREKRGVVWIIS